MQYIALVMFLNTAYLKNKVFLKQVLKTWSNVNFLFQIVNCVNGTIAMKGKAPNKETTQNKIK